MGNVRDCYQHADATHTHTHSQSDMNGLDVAVLPLDALDAARHRDV